jgi:hypothetical protein
MTDEIMNLRTLLEKSSDADLLREMSGFAAQRLIELEVEGKTCASYGQKSTERLVQRNGYRDRLSETRAVKSHGHDRHLQEPSQPAVRGNRRQGEGIPQPSDRRRFAVSVDRRHLREGAGADASYRSPSLRRLASTAMAAAKCWACRLGLQRRRPSGPRSCASEIGCKSKITRTIGKFTGVRHFLAVYEQRNGWYRLL